VEQGITLSEKINKVKIKAMAKNSVG